MRLLILIISSIFLLSACGGGGGGGSPSFVHDINNVPKCSDTGTAFQTTEYYFMDYNDSTDKALAQVCASTAYANGATGGSGVKIGINDTGLNLQSDGKMGHQEFGDVGSANSRIILGYNSDVVRNDEVPEDEDGHGSHVAGIIGADKDNVGMHGIAYNATLYPIKTLTPRGSPHSVAGKYTVAWGFYLTDYYDLDIINNSWGYPESEIGVTCNSKETCESALNDATSYSYTYYYFQRMATEQNAMLVWSAGNQSKDNPSALNGACIYDSLVTENCVIVVALGTDGKIASYSNKCGIASAVCISAPGSLVSAYNTDTDDYYELSGTSMSAPLVSGGLALIKQVHTSLTHAQVIDRLFATAVDHDVYSQTSIYGHGLMDIGAATSAIGSLQLINANSNNLDSYQSTYTEIYENSFNSNSSFYSGLKESLKNKTMEVYDSFDRANFSIYLDSFFHNINITEEYSATKHLDNLLQIDDDYSVLKNNYGVLKSYNSKSFTRSIFETKNKKLRIATNMQSNLFFDSSRTNMGFNSPKLITKFFRNPYFYNDNENVSLNINNKYVSSNLFIDEELDNFGISINIQPTSENFFNNDSLGNIEISLGETLEKNKILNSYGTGSFNISDISNTKFAAIKYKKEFEKINIFGNINYGSTELKSNSYFFENEAITTRSFSLGFIKSDFINRKNRISFLISQPQKVIDGSIGLRVPTSSNNERQVNYTNYDLNLAPNATEINYDLLFAREINKNDTLYLNYTHVKNPIHNNLNSSVNNVSLLFKKLF